MISAQQQRDWLQQLVTAFDYQHAANADWFHASRTSARQAIDSLPGLHRKQEAWRYSRIDQLFEQALHVPKLTTIAEQDIQRYLIQGLDSYRLVMLNGFYQPQLSSNDLPAGVRLAGLQQLLEQGDPILADIFRDMPQHNEHMLTALNTALIHDGTVIYIDRDVQLEKPVEIIYLNTEAGALVQSRNLVALAEHASATLVERFIGEAQPAYFHNNVSDIVLSKSAALKHYRLQQESPQAYHMSSLYLQQQQHSRYDSTCLALGGRWSRADITITLQQEYAECYLNGLYTVGENQLNDFHLDVQHRVPNCTSREQYKGIVYAKGRGVFDGHIIVEEQAQKSDAQLSNDNLLLTRDGEIDTKPQLEIYADDVKCSHGTTVGQLDEQQLFYMRSRGLSEQSAKKMLCLGFASDIIDTISIETLHQYASQTFMATLEQAVAEI